MLHQGRSKKMTLQLANFSASCVTLEYNISRRNNVWNFQNAAMEISTPFFEL
jgi:hypothetical protein